MDICRIEELFDLSHTQAAPLFEQKQRPWEVLGELKEFIKSLGTHLPADEYNEIAPQVWVAKTARIAPSALLNGPCIIGADTEVRHGAFIRGSVLVGKGAVVGNSVELKNSILFDGAQVPHFNYVGDSILGYKAHLGAGAVTSNLKSDRSLVCIKQSDDILVTGLKKLGALVGDGAEVGCNSVLCPGAVLGKYSQVYPTSCVRGVIPHKHIFKDAQHIVPKN